jgi:plasmid segregation protein ParM
MAKQSAPEAVIDVGCDDGFSNTDVVVLDEAGNVKSTKITSRARSGMFTTTQVAGLTGDVTPVYETEGLKFTVGLEDGESAGFEDYPYSHMNRAIVHHALRVAGLGGKKIRLCTGLPLERYFNGDVPDDAVIARKMQSLGKAVKSVDGTPVAEIVEQYVFAEGLAGWMDYAVSGDGIFRAPEDETVGFLDLGGRTADMGVIRPGARVDFARCSTVNFGMLNVVDELVPVLTRKFDATLPHATIEKALVSRKVRLFGKDVDISVEVASAVRNVADSILNEANRCLGKGADLDKVLIMGGGAYVFDVVKNAFPHAVVLPDPELANARGFAKFMRLQARQRAAA